MELIFIRHGKAEDFSSTGKDADRALTVEGVAELKNYLPLLRKIIPQPNLILSSPYLRARQTADLVGKAFGAEVELTDALRQESAPIDFSDELENHSEQVIFAVSHQPFLTHVSGWLVTGREYAIASIPRGGVCWLQSRGALVPGQCILRSLIRPDQLLNLSGLGQMRDGHHE